MKKIETFDQAKAAGEFFLKKGVKNSIITLGEKGIYFSNQEDSIDKMRSVYPH
mgnify:CR=1 FL=1